MAGENRIAAKNGRSASTQEQKRRHENRERQRHSTASLSANAAGVLARQNRAFHHDRSSGRLLEQTGSGHRNHRPLRPALPENGLRANIHGKRCDDRRIPQNVGLADGICQKGTCESCPPLHRRHYDRLHRPQRIRPLGPLCRGRRTLPAQRRHPSAIRKTLAHIHRRCQGDCRRTARLASYAGQPAQTEPQTAAHPRQGTGRRPRQARLHAGRYGPRSAAPTNFLWSDHAQRRNQTCRPQIA